MNSWRAVTIATAILIFPRASAAQLSGRVVDGAGAPLAGVFVWGGVPHASTDAQGTFTLIPDREWTTGADVLIRFSKEGYRTTTKLRSELLAEPEVRLESPQDVWTAPKCSAVKSRPAPRTRLQCGERLCFRVPRGARITGSSDIDYSTASYCLGQACARHGTGAMWSMGYWVGTTFAEYFKEKQHFTERDIFDVSSGTVWGEDYRIVYADGTRTRQVGTYGETVTYFRADPSIAAIFDQMLDSLCWR